VGKSEKRLPVLFSFVMALTSAAIMMFQIIQFFLFSMLIDAFLASKESGLKILNETEAIILPVVSLCFHRAITPIADKRGE